MKLIYFQFSFKSRFLRWADTIRIYFTFYFADSEVVAKMSPTRVTVVEESLAEPKEFELYKLTYENVVLVGAGTYGSVYFVRWDYCCPDRRKCENWELLESERLERLLLLNTCARRKVKWGGRPPYCALSSSQPSWSGWPACTSPTWTPSWWPSTWRAGTSSPGQQISTIIVSSQLASEEEDI